MNDSTIANDATALQSTALFKDQMYTEMPNNSASKLKLHNCISSETQANKKSQKHKEIDTDNKEFSFEKTTISKKSSTLRNLEEFYELQKSKTSEVMKKLHFEAQQKLPLLHLSITRWIKITEKMAITDTAIATATFIIIFIMMIYYLCGVSDGHIAWWAGVELIGGINMLLLYFKTISLVDHTDSKNHKYYIIVAIINLFCAMGATVAIFGIFNILEQWNVIGYAFTQTINKGEKRRGVFSLFMTYCLVSCLLKLLMVTLLMFSVYKLRSYKKLLHNEERIANTSKPEYHI